MAHDQNALARAVLPFATQALHAAQLQDWDRATAFVDQLGREHGAEGVEIAMIGWIDTLLSHARPPDAEGFAQPVWQCAEHGHVTHDAHDLPPEIAWGGQLMTARANLDEDMWDALLTAIPAGQEGRYLGELLEMVALTLNGAIRDRDDRP